MGLLGFTQSYEGTDYWFSFMPNSDNAGAVHEVHFVSRFDTEAYIEIPLGGAPIYDTVIVPKETMVTYRLNPLGRTFPTASEVVTNRGIHVTVKDPSVVYIGNYMPYTSDASIAIPTSALGDEYDIVSYTFTEVGDSEFIITATEDNTKIEITFGGETLGGRAIGDVANITLNKGQTYLVKARTSTPIVPPPTSAAYKDLTGTKLVGTNGKNFSVYSGNQCVYVGGCPFCDHLFEQIRPNSTWGQTYYFSATQKGGTTADLIRVYALEDGTTYNFNGAPQVPLNAGQHFDHDIAAGGVIEASGPIHVSQYLRGSSCSAPPLELDPLMMDILPVEQFSPYYIFGASSYARYSKNWATVVIETAETASLRLDGAALAGVTWLPIVGTTYSYGYVALARGASYVIESITLAKFGLFVYGHGTEESYGYTAGGNLIVLDGCPKPRFETMDVCFGEDVDFTDQSIDPQFDIDLWVWDFGDGSPNTIISGVGATSNTRHTYPAPGIYTVTLTVSNTKDPPCMESISMDVEVYENPTVTAGPNTNMCEGDSLFLNGVIVGGTTPYRVTQWTGEAIDNNLALSTFAIPTTPGSYTLDVVDANYCEGTSTFDVTLDTKPIVSLANLSDICEGESTVLVVNYTGTDSVWVTVRNTLSYFEELKEVHNGVFPDITPNGTTKYWISDAVKKEGNPLCISINPDSVEINVKPLPTAFIEGNPVICEGEDTELLATTFGADGPWILHYTENGVAKTQNISADSTLIAFNGLSDSTNIELVSIEYASAPACPNLISGSASIAVNKEVDAGTDTQVDVCKTVDSYNLFDNLGGNPDEGGTWTAITPGAALSGNAITPTLMNGGVYVFTYKVAAEAPCPDQEVTMEVTITTAPKISGIAEVCTEAGDEYFVTGIITGGDPSTYSTTNGTITFDGVNYIFQSAPFASETPYSITISDGFGCGIIELNGSKKCNCLTSAGTMETDSTLLICENGIVDAIALFNNDAVDDGDDAFVFILHTGSGNALGNILAFNDVQPYFSYPAGVVFGTTYYISSVAANASGGTYGVDLNDECLDVSQGVPVNFIPLPTAIFGNDSTLCAGSPSAIPLTFTGFQPFGLVNTNGDSITGFSANDFLVLNPQDDSTLTFIEVFDTQCSNTVSHVVNLEVIQIPSANMFGGNVYCDESNGMHAVEVDIDGDGTVYTMTYNISNGAFDSTITVGNLSNGTQAVPGVPILNIGTNTFTITGLQDNSGLTCPEFLEGFAEVVVNALPEVSLNISPVEICFGDSIWITPTITPNDAVVDILFENVTTGETFTFPAVGNGQAVPFVPSTGAFEFRGVEATNVLTNCTKLITDVPTAVNINPAPSGEVYSNIQICNGTDSNRVRVEIDGVSPFSLNVSRNGTDVFGSPQIVNGSIFEFTELQGPGNFIYDISYLADNSNGSCLGTALRIDSVEVTPLPSAQFTDNFLEVCIGSDITINTLLGGQGQISAQVREITTGQTFTVIGDDSTPVSFAVNNVLDSLYYVFDDIYDVSNPNVCHGTSTDTLAVFVNPLPLGDFKIQPALKTVCDGEGTVMDVNSANTPSGVIYFTNTQNAQTFETPFTNYIGSQAISNLGIGASVFRLDSVRSSIGAQCSAPILELDTAFVRPLPTATMGYNADFICFGTGTEFNLGATGSHPMELTITEDGGNPQNYIVNPGQSFDIPVSPNQTIIGSVTNIQYTSLPFCAQTPSNIGDTLQVITLPEVAFTNEDGRICLGESFNLILGNTLPNLTTITLSDGFLYTETLVTTNGVEVITITPTTEGINTYYISAAVDNFGCPAADLDTVFVETLPAPTVNFGAIDTASCPPFTVDFVNASVGTFVDCTWNFGDGSVSQGSCDAISHPYPFSGIYPVSLTLTTAEGCVSTLTKENYINIFPVPEADFSYAPTKPDIRNTVVDFINRSKGADMSSWTFAQNDYSNLENPFFQFPFEDEGIYDVELAVANIFGCTDSITKKVKIEGLLNVNIPNSFTPDGDGINDGFLPIIEGHDTELTDYYFGVYDRWGIPVFQTTTMNVAWDGKDNKGNMTKNDNYYYVVEVRSKYSAERQRFTGNVTLIK